MRKCDFDKYLKVLIGDYRKAINPYVSSVSSGKASAIKIQTYFLPFLNLKLSKIHHLEDLGATVL